MSSGKYRSVKCDTWCFLFTGICAVTSIVLHPCGICWPRAFALCVRFNKSHIKTQPKILLFTWLYGKIMTVYFPIGDRSEHTWIQNLESIGSVNAVLTVVNGTCLHSGPKQHAQNWTSYTLGCLSTDSGLATWVSYLKISPTSFQTSPWFGVMIHAPSNEPALSSEFVTKPDEYSFLGLGVTLRIIHTAHLRTPGFHLLSHHSKSFNISVSVSLLTQWA